jgi:small subunit ribosomal protein S17
MTATKDAVQAPAAVGARRNEKVGQVVSTKMQKTIVVEVEMRKAHAKYKRIVRRQRSFMPTTSRVRRGWATWCAFARPVR